MIIRGRRKHMSKLSKLTKTQLDNMLLDAQTELNRRKSVAKAEIEISETLKKYSITIDDIDLASLRSSADRSRKGGTSAKKKAKGAGVKDDRAVVAPKYKSVDGSQTWTGRGRAPKWVVSQCEGEGMSVDAFKQDTRFLIAENKISSRQSKG